METNMTIGKVAKQAGVNIQTIRFYERKGLLTPDGHRDSGYRLYGPQAAQMVRFIKNAQCLGFSLKEIASLLRLRVSRRAQCSTVRRKAQAKLDDVEQKLASLRSMERVLKDLVRQCSKKATTNKCPILKCLDSGCN